MHRLWLRIEEILITIARVGRFHQGWRLRRTPTRLVRADCPSEASKLQLNESIQSQLCRQVLRIWHACKELLKARLSAIEYFRVIGGNGVRFIDIGRRQC